MSKLEIKELWKQVHYLLPQSEIPFTQWAYKSYVCIHMIYPLKIWFFHARHIPNILELQWSHILRTWPCKHYKLKTQSIHLAMEHPGSAAQRRAEGQWSPVRAVGQPGSCGSLRLRRLDPTTYCKLRERSKVKVWFSLNVSLWHSPKVKTS